MKSLSNIFSSSTFKKIMPVLFLSCVTLVCLSNNNVDAKLTKPQKQETANNHAFAKLEEKFDAKLGVFGWILVQTKQ